MDIGSCTHVQEFIHRNGLAQFRVIHTYFVTCLREGARERKVDKCHCYQCHTRRGRLHACLTCMYLGCFANGHIIKHYQDHHQAHHHVISMDCKFGNIFCHECNDYKYDSIFENRSLMYKRKLSKLLDLEYYSAWEPTAEEIRLIKAHGGLKKVHDKSPIGFRGLVNLGHTCFMNCIVQVLVHTPLLKDYFLSDTHLCEMEDPKYCLVCEMFSTFQEFYSGNQVAHVPYRLVYLMWTHAKHLNGYQQQDAHEFYIAILDILHKQCQGTVPDETKRCNCVIDQIFKGFYQSDIVCQECNHVSTTYDPFLDISLNLGGNSSGSENGVQEHTVSLLDCISRYTQPENLSYQCGNCHGASRTKQLTLKVLPVITCFHLKRLEHSSGLKKNTTHVNFPVCFDMSPYMSSSRSMQPNGPTVNENDAILNMSESENRLCLFGVVTHKGDRDGGHYICYIRQRNNKWYQCDDSLIIPAETEDVLASEGYLLFYHKQVLEYGTDTTVYRQADPEVTA